MSETFGLKKETVAAMQAVFARFPEVGQVIIYGSRAKGNYKPNSDIDLTLIAAEGAELDLSTEFRIDEALDDLLIPYEIDLSRLTSISNPNLVDHIQRVGQVFYP